ncbi:hypothetical protein Ancab_000281 [Ancistrocladus abbreviatus]
MTKNTSKTAPHSSYTRDILVFPTSDYILNVLSSPAISIPPASITRSTLSLSSSLCLCFIRKDQNQTIMALRLPVSHPSWSALQSISPMDKVRCGIISRQSPKRPDFCPPAMTKRRAKTGRERVSIVQVKASLETVGDQTLVGQVTEVSKDTFWPIVEAAGDKTVVLDMYTQWCGPCKVIAPKFQELSEKYLDVVFLKLDCNQENKPLAKELGIRVVPTFKILKNGEIIKEVTGAKFDDLLAAIDAARCS